MPYDAKASITDQVNASISSSLKNLHTSETADEDSTYVDCLVLHSPYPSFVETQEAWQAMEKHVPKHARTLGLSNVYQIDVLEALYDSATVKPSVIQNRFYAQSGHDKEIRGFCVEKGLRYQSFWTLTGNPNLLRSKTVANLAKKIGVSTPIALYSLVLGLGSTSVLDGTTNAGRMKEDLDGISKAAQWAQQSPHDWRSVQDEFQTLIDD